MGGVLKHERTEIVIKRNTDRRLFLRRLITEFLYRREVTSSILCLFFGFWLISLSRSFSHLQWECIFVGTKWGTPRGIRCCNNA